MPRKSGSSRSSGSSRAAPRASATRQAHARYAQQPSGVSSFAPASSSTPSSSGPSHSMASPAAPHPQPTIMAVQPPSMLQQMAATAGGVAVGSAVGHVVGQGLSSMFSPSEAVAAPAPGAPSQQNSEPQVCSWEVKQFLDCAQKNSDISLCEGFNEAIRQCRRANGVAAE